MNNVERDSSTSVVLSVQNTSSNRDMALKLHRQFAHPSQEKLLQLLNSAGEPWASNKDLKEEIIVQKNVPPAQFTGKLHQDQ